jgi:sirohydrochlorin ferrochelatase
LNPPIPLPDRPAFPCGTDGMGEGLTVRQLVESLMIAALAGAEIASPRGSGNLAILAVVERGQSLAAELLRRWDGEEQTALHVAESARVKNGRGWKGGTS